MSVLDQLLHVLFLKSVQNVPEVLSVWHSSLRQFAWKEPHEVLVFLHHGPKREHRQLVVERNVYALDFVQLQKVLLFSEDFFEEVFVHHVLRRQVKLHYAHEVTP